MGACQATKVMWRQEVGVEATRSDFRRESERKTKTGRNERVRDTWRRSFDDSRRAGKRQVRGRRNGSSNEKRGEKKQRRTRRYKVEEKGGGGLWRRPRGGALARGSFSRSTAVESPAGRASSRTRSAAKRGEKSKRADGRGGCTAASESRRRRTMCLNGCTQNIEAKDEPSACASQETEKVTRRKSSRRGLRDHGKSNGESRDGVNGADDEERQHGTSTRPRESPGGGGARRHREESRESRRGDQRRRPRLHKGRGGCVCVCV